MNTSADILNFVSLDERLACSGQPELEQFPLLAAEGFTATIYLATNTSTNHLPQEPELCARAGIDFTWVPVVWNTPTPQDYFTFQRWLDANRNRKVLVHCALNWRASMFCALYRIIREGLDPAEAREEVLGIWEPDEVWIGLARAVLGKALPGARGFF